MKHFDKENIIVLCIAAAFLIGWFFWYPKYQAKQNVQRQEAQAAAQAAAQALEAKAQAAKLQLEKHAAEQQKAASAAKNAPAAATAATTKHPAVVLQNKLIAFTINPDSGTIDKVVLQKYDTSDRKEKITIDSDAAPHKTAAVDGLDGWTLTHVSPIQPRGAVNAVHIFRTFQQDGKTLMLTQIFELPHDSYNLRQTLTLKNEGKEKIELPQLRVWASGMPPMRYFAGDKLYNQMHRIEYCSTQSKDMKSLDPAVSEEKFSKAGTTLPVDWIGVTNKYFASLLFAAPGFDGGMEAVRTPYPVPGGKEGSVYYIPAVGGIYKNVVLEPGASKEYVLWYFAGPKTLEEVKKLPESAMPILHISSFSLMEYIARPVLWLLNYLKGLCGNYGLAIILLTLIVRIVFFPLTERGNRSMRKMSKIAPQAKEIREKYKDNPQLMNQKTMELYRTAGVSPLGGCLPILVQIPVFFALYAALDSAVELRHVSFLWITDMTKPDLVGPQIFGYGLHPLVIVMTLLMILQQRLTPSNMEPMQQKMMMLMPLVMLVFLYNLPAGLTLYWTVSQVFSILQMKYSLYIAKRDEEKNNSQLPTKSA